MSLLDHEPDRLEKVIRFVFGMILSLIPLAFIILGLGVFSTINPLLLSPILIGFSFACGYLAMERKGKRLWLFFAWLIETITCLLTGRPP